MAGSGVGGGQGEGKRGNNPTVRGHNGWRNEHSRHVGTTLLWACRSVRQRAPVTLRGPDQPRAKQEAQVRFNASSPPTLAPREGEGREVRRGNKLSNPGGVLIGVVLIGRIRWDYFCHEVRFFSGHCFACTRWNLLCLGGRGKRRRRSDDREDYNACPCRTLLALGTERVLHVWAMCL